MYASDAKEAAAPKPKPELPQALNEDVKAVAKDFRMIINEASPMLRTYLKKARLSAGEGNRLLIVLPDELSASAVATPDHKEEIQSLIEQKIGPPLTDSFARFYGFDDEKSWKAVEYYREYYQDTGIFECSVYPGFEKSLKALKAAGKRLFVATSKPEVYARRIIEHFDLDQYFEYVAGMELDGGRGSKAEVIGYLIDTCRMQDKKRILMIGDREHDVLGAKQEGLDCMGVLYGFGNREELEKAGAVYVAGTPEDIAGIILK